MRSSVFYDEMTAEYNCECTEDNWNKVVYIYYKM